jgi:diguanylate cyclase (GGDEF)-like protein
MHRANPLLKAGVPAAIAAGLGLLFWLEPGSFLWFYPAAGAFFIWFHWAGEREIKYIFLFLLTALGFLLTKIAPGAGELPALLALLAQLLALWLLFFSLNLAESSRARAREKLASLEADAAARLKSLRDELAVYKVHQAGALARIRDKDALSAAAQAMGSAQTLEEIKLRLQQLVAAYFPGASAQLHSGAPRDAAENWVAERKLPLLVRNAQSDARFPPGSLGAEERSLIALPLHLFGALVGFVRVAAPEPERFKAEDLRGAELLCSQAGVSMENICLFEKVRELAIKDGLTGLYTHRAFQARLEEEILRSARTRTPFSLVMTDIDHFKSYNDRFGHQAGDAVLKAVAAVLSDGVRDVDFTARYGGEEFAVIVTGADKRKASAAAETLRQVVAEQRFEFGGEAAGVTASFGVAEFPAEAATASQLVRAADERLYRAKKGGRNKVVHE